MNSHRKAEKVRLCDYHPGGCSKQKSVQYNIPIEVPSVPPTDLTSSSVCRVKYELQVNILQRCAINHVIWSIYNPFELRGTCNECL